jgi:glyoxylase-like metal-dependent hydrolase (beta-lactamase superfamily II)
LFRSLEKQDRRLKEINIITGEGSHASLFSSNVYSIGKRTISLVDAGEHEEVNRIISVFEHLNFKLNDLSRVIITHSHDDHWEGVKTLLQMVPLQIMVYKNDVSYYRQEFNTIKNITKYSLLGLQDGDIIAVGNHRLQVLHTPGHDGGSICLYDEANRILFSGDTVFASGTTGSLRSGNLADLTRGDIALKNANKVIQLALERLTWLDRIPDDAPHWMRMRRSSHRHSS